MAKYYLTNKAVEDLNGIWNYTVEHWSEAQADKYYNMLIGFCRDIAENPGIGKKYDDVSTGLFGLKANRHIIFYRKIESGLVEITRFLHGHMDLKNRLTE